MSKTLKIKVSNMNKAVAQRRAKFVAATLMGVAGTASAQSGGALDTQMLGNFGCAIYNFLTGPLAIWAFILVLVGTLLVGLIAKIDFSKIIVVVVVFALIQAIGTYVMGMDSVASKIGTASCLTN